MSFDFTAALARPTAEIKRPPPPPEGYYTARITRIPSTDLQALGTSTWAKMSVQMVLEQPWDVDEAAWEEFSADGASVTNIPIRRDIMFNTEDPRQQEEALAQLRELLDIAGITGDTLGEMLADCVDAKLVIPLSHRANPDDPEQVFMESRGKPLPVE